GRALPPPPPAPRIATAAELIPADLDVVVRLDLAHIKGVLGELTPELLAREVLARTGSGNAGEPDELLVESLLRAKLVYLGYRPSAELLPLDRVLALQGAFEPLTRPPRGFAAPIDLGADLRYWDKQRGAEPLPRSGVARLYAVGERLRAFVSEAELDSVERALDGRAGPFRLEAPEEGALSLAVRPRLLARFVNGSLGELLADAKTLEVVLELASDGAKLKLSLLAGGPEQAERLARAGEIALTRALGERAKRAEIDVVGERLSLAWRASRAELSALFVCLKSAPASAAECAW
ncbi:MAG TPA: hypothetical protein VEQ59_23025, partial [Polyangiaceae bacterium]|nr:hypothetical protein [Polyangiaceae bacterium]